MPVKRKKGELHGTQSMYIFTICIMPVMTYFGGEMHMQINLRWMKRYTSTGLHVEVAGVKCPWKSRVVSLQRGVIMIA